MRSDAERSRGGRAALTEPRKPGDREELSWEAADALRRMILAPIAEHPGKSRLLIVSEGTLQYVPFAALPGVAGGREPLVLTTEIVGLPSASVLAELRKERDAIEKPPQEVLAVFADPVFDRPDERVRGAASRARAQTRLPRELSAVVRDYAMTRNESGFSRLSFTGRQV